MPFPNAPVPNQMLAKTPQGLGSLNPTSPQQNAYQIQPETDKQTNMPGGMGGQGGFNQPQVQQALGGFGQQKMQQAQPQMITAQLQGQIMAQPQQLGGMGGGFNEMTNTKPSPLQMASIGAPAPGPMAPDLARISQLLQGSTQAPQGLGGLAAYGPQAYKAGGSVNLKDAAQKLAAKGRGGDTILAHINPQEAAMLKRMGGSGTINPHTGLPEFLFGINVPIVDDIIDVGKDVLKGVEKAVIRPIGDIVEPILPYVKYVAPFIPGVGPLAAVGLGALSSGFAGPGGFNLKRGIMGGITAYGMSNIAAGLGEAGAAGGSSDFGATSTPGASSVANTPPSDYSLSTGGSGTGINPNASLGAEGTGSLTPPPSGPYAPPSEGISWANTLNPVDAAPSSSGVWDKLTTNPYTTGEYLQGLKNVTGLGPQGYAGIADASKAFGTKAGIGSAAATLMGTTGEMAVNEAEKFKKEAEDAANLQETKKKRYRTLGLANMEAHPWNTYAAGGDVSTNTLGNINPASIATRLGINGPAAQDQTAAQQNTIGGINPVVAAGRFNFTLPTAPNPAVNAGWNGVMPGSLTSKIKGILGNKQEKQDRLDNALADLQAHPWKKYAEGGAIDDNQGIYGQADGLATGGTPISNFAAGGTTNPRFLSGGGDGMSDSIPATIDNKQPARLADGEFVIPADVVSHIGNGSSKAGAKRLYSMMANVRKARTGNPNQGKQINPKKYLPA